ncbi:MAG: substrate-binding domain-containing protein [Verrucomicrobia bacterium]|nr:substrate-binding domain-containing protein [Verrucomicrobiota bacterium]
MASLRAGERVLNCLETEFLRPELPMGTRLPTIRQLSHRLRVCERTVQGVFDKLAQQGRIRCEVGRGTFFMGANGSRAAEWRIALGIPISGPAMNLPFLSGLNSGILQAAAKRFPPLMLVPRSCENRGCDSLVQSLVDDCSRVDGIILFPVWVSDEIRPIYERHGKPVVDINPPADGATANFVSPDYFESSRRIAEVWRQTGRRRILLLLGVSIQKSVSSRLRRFGVETGLGDELLNEEVRFKIARAKSYSEEDGYSAMQDILSRGGEIPDAVLCMGDLLALGVARAAREKGIRIPVEMSVVGGSGIDLSHSHHPCLTRTVQPLDKIGEAAVDMICQRLERRGNGTSSVAGRIFSTPWIGGETTRPEENELLHISDQ